jgi:hypothetical protein
MLLVNLSVMASCAKHCCCLWPEDGPLRNETCSHCKLYVNTTFILAVVFINLCCASMVEEYYIVFYSLA